MLQTELGQFMPRERERMSGTVIARSEADDVSAVARRAKAEAIHTVSEEALWIASLPPTRFAASADSNPAKLAQRA